jgi:uncharacterized membrane protein
MRSSSNLFCNQQTSVVSLVSNEISAPFIIILRLYSVSLTILPCYIDSLVISMSHYFIPFKSVFVMKFLTIQFCDITQDLPDISGSDKKSRIQGKIFGDNQCSNRFVWIVSTH